MEPENTEIESLSERLKEVTEQQRKSEIRPLRNRDFFEELKQLRKNKQAEKLEKRIDDAINELKTQETYIQASEQKQSKMIEKKERQTRKKYEGAPLNQLDIVQILKYESMLFHCINLADTETDEQKELYIFDWDTGTYTKDITFLYKIINPLNPSTTEKIDKAISYALKKHASMYYTKPAEKSGRYIAFKNGLFDSETGLFSERFNPEVILLNSIPFNYNPNAIEPVRHGLSITGVPIEWKGSDIVAMFKNGDEQREQLFYEVCRAILGAKRNAFLYAWNEKGNGGKSTVGELFCCLAGEEHTKRMNIDGLGGRFARANIEKYKLIYGDDRVIGSSASPAATATLKELVTGERTASEQKGKDVKNSYFKGIIYQCSNDLFTTDDKTNGIVRRCIFLPFSEIPRDKTCTAVSDWIKENEFIEWIIKETLEHCPTAPEKYTEPTNNEQYKQDFKENNDPFIAFVDDYIKPLTEYCERIPLVFIYRYLFPQFIEDYPTLEKTTIQELNKAIKEKMKILGYDLKRRSRINNQQFHPPYEDANGNNKNYYDLLIKRNKGRNDFNSVYIKES